MIIFFIIMDEKIIYDYLFIIMNKKEVLVSREYLRSDMIIGIK